MPCKRASSPIIAALILLLTSNVSSSFTIPSGRAAASLSQSTSSFVGGDNHFARASPNNAKRVVAREGSSQLKCALPAIVTKVASPPIRNSLLIGSAAIALYRKRRKLVASDSKFTEPVPEGECFMFLCNFHFPLFYVDCSLFSYLQFKMTFQFT